MLLYALCALFGLWAFVNLPLWVLLYLAAEAAVQEELRRSPRPTT